MKPHQFVLLWFAGAASYFSVVFLIAGLIPEGTLLSWYNTLFGEVSGYQWDRWYGDFLFIGAVFLNGALIGGVAFIWQKWRRKNL